MNDEIKSEKGIKIFEFCAATLFWMSWGWIFWHTYQPKDPEGHYILIYLALIISLQIFYGILHDEKVKAACKRAYLLWKYRKGMPVVGNKA